MKAALLPAYGDANAFEVKDAPEPQPKAGEIKVRLVAASLNPIDWKVRSGSYKQFMTLELPAILGRDAAGEVVQLGEGVTAFKAGDKVLGFVSNAYAEFVAAPVEAWAKAPAGLDLASSAVIPLVALTGAQLATGGVNAKSGETVLVIGANGGVGRAAVFVLKKLGAKVIAGVRRKQLAEAESIHADSVVALDDADAVAQLPQLDALADTVGGATTQKLLGKLKAGGRIGSVVGEPAGAKDRGFTVQAIFTKPDPKALAELAQAVADGKLLLPVARSFPLAQVSDAHRLAEAGGVGKVLLTF